MSQHSHYLGRFLIPHSSIHCAYSCRNFTQTVWTYLSLQLTDIILYTNHTQDMQLSTGNKTKKAKSRDKFYPPGPPSPTYGSHCTSRGRVLSLRRLCDFRFASSTVRRLESPPYAGCILPTGLNLNVTCSKRSQINLNCTALSISIINIFLTFTCVFPASIQQI